MLHVSCLYGRVHVEVLMPPNYINECNCNLCGKSGARWAYYHPSAVTMTGPLKGYVREDKADPAAEIHFCERCGSTTRFTLTPSAVAKFGNVQAGVNMSLANEGDLAGIEMRYPDGRAWSGGTDFGYVRAPRIIGD